MENNIETIDSLCRETVKSIHKGLMENRARIDYLEELLQKAIKPDEPEHSPEQNLLFEALGKAKASMPVDFEKTGEISNRGTYAKYPDLVHFAKAYLEKFDIDVIHEFIERDKSDLMKTTITHKSGQWRSSICALRIEYSKQQDPNQAYQDCVTRMKKTVYAGILNLHTGGD